MIIKMNWKPSVKDMRIFGVILIVGPALIGFGLQSLGKPYGFEVTVSGALAGVLAILFPRLSRPIYWLWIIIGMVIGSIVSRIIILLIYFLILTPFAVVFRLMGRDVLRIKKPSESTYWSQHPESFDKSSYKHLF